jgi:hypothetical protein
VWLSISLSGLHSFVDMDMRGRDMGGGMCFGSLGCSVIKCVFIRLV